MPLFTMIMKLIPRTGYRNPQYFNKLLRDTLSVLSTSILAGYATVAAIVGLPSLFEIKIPLFAGGRNIGYLGAITVWNLIISGTTLAILFYSPGLASGKSDELTSADALSDKVAKEEAKLKRSIRRKQWGLVVLALSGISSIYLIVKFTGGFFWSPFTGYYSLIVTTLSLCLSIWGSADNSYGKRLWTVFVTCALLLVVFISIFFDPIPLETKYKMAGYKLESKYSAEINKLLNTNCNNDKINSSMTVNDETLILHGILSETTEGVLVKAISNLNINVQNEVSLKNEIIYAVRSVGMQSRLIDENSNSYKLVFLFIIALSTIISIFLPTMPTHVDRGDREKRSDLDLRSKEESKP